MLRLKLSAGSSGIADFQSPIADWPLALETGFMGIELLSISISNWQSEFGNWK
jgi:hypothetical protein